MRTAGLVSVVLPAFNCEDFLARALESVLAQSYPHWEVIVVNDGSADETASIANEFAKRDSRVSVIHQRNRGLSGARNVGLARATGEFVQLLDADDSLLPHKLGEQVGWLRAHPQCAMVYGEGLYFRDGKKVSTEYPPPRKGVLRELLIRNFILVNAGIFRATVLSDIGGFKESSSVRYPLYGCEDWDFWLRMACAGWVITEVPGVVVHNHWHNENMSSSDVKMRRSHLWVLLEAAQGEAGLSGGQRLLLHSQIVFRHFLYLSALAKAGCQEELASERTESRPGSSAWVFALPYWLGLAVPSHRYPKFAGSLASLVGKLCQRIL